jgi:hypothetical protein
MLLKREENNGVVKCIFDSSNILESTYNTSTQELIVTFTSGNRYSYPGVSKTDFMRFEMADSQGKVFNSHIKKYDSTKLTPVDPSKIIAEAHQLYSLEKVAEYNSRRNKLAAGLTQIINIPNVKTPEDFKENVTTFVTELEKLKIAVDNFIKDFKTI